ncbi:erythromycin esterase family protein [Halomonas sediminis]|uniref:Erythromycin esterase family protein n=1 Tax=Vreelandella zhuhanensis TaxID=2684210 RepID=A0A7X3H1P2_9GAMM|nr:erythromycin esterase family protein [Halomonas zhuhanensis]MWJ27880.1 erythromycin esterase family protein [Halomonas zhuhanensis]
MKRDDDKRAVQAIEENALELKGTAEDYDAIVEAARGKRFVMIGEASHGTQEFYRIRAEITRRLIEEEGFAAVAVEADWPDAYAVNRYVWNVSSASRAEEALNTFKRFPVWMWANTEVRDFVRWLASFNEARSTTFSQGERPVGFYGLDLYSMGNSVHAVLDYLDKHDPPAAKRARDRYACLDQFLDEPHRYGRSVELGLTLSCEQEIIDQLVELQHQILPRLKGEHQIEEEHRFCVEQNAKVVLNAEEYYRSMFQGRVSSWNLRDGHMFETLEALQAHLSEKLDRPAGIVVWAHNSHIGNAAVTDMGRWGEFNIGQLAREKYAENALLVGFSTATGEVTAATDWDGAGEHKSVREPLEDSYERLFHQVKYERFLLDLRKRNAATAALETPRLHRAIGVIYRPETERQSHYFHSTLSQQYDFILHIDKTHALEALTEVPRAADNEPADTYPTGY